MTEKGLMTYQDKTGNDIQLSFNIVRNYLVTGKRDLVTDQEIMFFMGICKARQLNPFAKDCYLTKYTQNDPAAIIVAVDYFRARARVQDDYQGYECGVIVQKPDGELRYSHGLVLEGEKLLGGWFEAQPKGWLKPFKLEVNLAGYIKKKFDGGVTRFWSEENQPTMISKVAESQGLRKCWPNEFQGIYSSEEINSFDTVDITPLPQDMPPPAQLQNQAESPAGSDFVKLVNQFESMTARDGLDTGAVAKFIQAIADHKKKEVNDIVAESLQKYDKFLTAFRKWEAKNTPQEAVESPLGSEQPEDSQEVQGVVMASQEQLKTVYDLCIQNNYSLEAALEDCNIKTWNDLTADQAQDFISKLSS